LKKWTKLYTFDHTKLNQEDINHLSRSITSNKKEGAIKNLPKNKTPEPEGLSDEFYETFKE
jgi:hypothetical protein